MTTSTRIPIVLGNWKMNTSLNDALALAASAAEIAAAHPEVEVGVLPPALWLVPIAERRAPDTAVMLGAQDVAPQPSGAFTGDLAAEMLAPFTRFMLAGHSERRQIHRETDADIRAKLDAVYRVKRTPVLAVGETEEQRSAGRAVEVVTRQLAAALADRPATELEQLVVAYEPVWAIGTGNAATADDAEEMASVIRSFLRQIDRASADRARILYGGSMNGENAGRYLGVADIDGGLIGGASLKPADFAAIVAAASAGTA